MGSYLSKPVVKTVSEEIESNGRYKCGVSGMQGWRNSMEDAHCSELDVDDKTGLFGVFDGHGGCDVAMYVAIHIAKVLVETESYQMGNFEDALRTTFMRLDENVLHKDAEEALKFLQTFSSNEKLPGIEKLKDMVDSYRKANQKEKKEVIDEAQMLCEEATMNIDEVLKRYETMAVEKSLEESVEPETATKSEHEEKKNNLEKALDNVSKPGQNKEENESKESEEKQINSDSSTTNGVKKETKVEDSKSGGDALVSSSEEEKSKEEKTVEDKKSQGGENGSPAKGEAPKRLTKLKPQKVKKSVELDEDEEDDEDFKVGAEDSDDGEDDEDSEEDDSDVDSDEDEENWEDLDEADKKSAILLNKFISESTSVEQPAHDSGTTATVALLVGKELVVANAGDSRCVVSRKDGKCHAMSEDHKPEDPIEESRIKKAGGQVSEQGRINGGLNLSRAIGDHNYKKNSSLKMEEQMVTAFPDVTRITLDEHDEFMVLACDGIWNVMENQAVVDFVRQRLYPAKYNLNDEPLSICKICEELFMKCLAPNTQGDGTGCDNMTCLIVQFEPDWLKSVDQSEAAAKRPSPSDMNREEPPAKVIKS